MSTCLGTNPGTCLSTCPRTGNPTHLPALSPSDSLCLVIKMTDYLAPPDQVTEKDIRVSKGGEDTRRLWEKTKRLWEEIKRHRSQTEKEAQQLRQGQTAKLVLDTWDSGEM